jgi:hypothetical protein
MLRKKNIIFQDFIMVELNPKLWLGWATTFVALKTELSTYMKLCNKCTASLLFNHFTCWSVIRKSNRESLL